MQPTEKAQELIEKMKPFVYCFMGSGMLTNDYDERVAVSMAKKCAAITVDEITEAIKTTTGHCELRRLDEQEVDSDLKYWERVKVEVERAQAKTEA